MDVRRHAVRYLLAITCLVSSAHAGDESHDADASEVKVVRESGAVIHDGKGHYLAFIASDLAADHGEARRIMFYGDGTTFYRVVVKAYSSETGMATWSILDERTGLNLQRSQLVRKDSTFTMNCHSTDAATPMTPLPAAEARTLLARAAFQKTRMDRAAYALGRDGTIYYYVDVASRSADNTDFRVYTGKRGAMKLLKVKHVAADSKGAVFTSKLGTLRVSVRPTTLTWAVKPSKEVKLSVLPLETNLELVYSELGVYTGKAFGVPCDDM